MSRASGSYVNATANTAASYLAFQGAISAQLNTILTRTTDTGQISTFNVAPTTGQRDYEVFRLTDSLQATAPIYIRIDYQQNAASFAYISVTVGTSTNGAGVLGGVTTPLNLALYAYVPTAGATRYAYSSTDGSQVMFIANLQAVVNGSAVNATNDFMSGFVVERTRDADGTPNAYGYMVYWFRSTSEGTALGNPAVSTAGIYARNNDVNAVQLPAVNDLAVTVPNLYNANSYLVGSTAYAFPAYGFGAQMMGASKALMVGLPGDFPKATPVTLTHYGAAMTFLPLPQCTASVAFNNAGTAAVRTMCPLFRWE